MCSGCRLRMNLPRSMPTPSTIPTPRSHKTRWGLIAEPPVSRWAPPDHRGVGSPPDTRKQRDLDIPDGWRRVPLHAGRAPAAVDRDLQQQPVAHPLKALQHAFLGHCGRVAWPRGFHPLGRPDHRRPGSLLEIAELHGCPPKIKSAALPALRPGHARPAGLACWFLPTLGRWYWGVRSRLPPQFYCTFHVDCCWVSEYISTLSQ